jgi:hypothetical protein
VKLNGGRACPLDAPLAGAVQMPADDVRHFGVPLHKLPNVKLPR